MKPSTSLGVPNAESLPKHVGIIMDGNGRWATQRHLPRIAGHRKGVERVNEITECAVKLGVQALTLYAFSEENWRRPENEVSGLMGLLRWYLRNERKKILENNIRFRVIGDRKKLSTDIVESIAELENLTLQHTGMHLAIALSYGSHGELIRAIQHIVHDAMARKIFPADLDPNLVESYLDTSGLPPVDMLIRTSGEKRLSNFLMWQAAYAELFFEDKHWPDFSQEVFYDLLHQYAGRHRRFGRTPEQVLGATSCSV